MLVNDPVFVEGALLPVYCRMARDARDFAIRLVVNIVSGISLEIL